MKIRPILLLTLLPHLLVAAPDPPADPELQPFLQQTLAAAREKYHLPGIAALIQIDGKIVAEAATGLRADGHPEPVTLGDRWHIGSDTKAFAATLIARLVEQHLMNFDETLGAAFPALATEMHPAYRNVTVTQLLSHTAGLPPLTDDKDLPALMAVIALIADVKAQRAAIARTYLTMPPASPAGEFSYSNLGFIIVGAIAEARTGKAWEELVREHVFAPLGIANVGFGAPGTSGRIDQPRGHRQTDGRFVPLDPADPDADNPPAIGPAGRINIELRDWLRFAADQLEGAHGRGKLLEAQTYRKLHTPVTSNYALGWGVLPGPQGVPLLLTHTGSNGFWMADIRIMPQHDMIFLVVMNAGSAAGEQAVNDIGRRLKERLKPYD